MYVCNVYHVMHLSNKITYLDMFREVYYSYCQHSIVTHFSEDQFSLSGVQYYHICHMYLPTMYHLYCLIVCRTTYLQYVE